MSSYSCVPLSETMEIFAAAGTNPVSLPGSILIPLDVVAVAPNAHRMLEVFEELASKMKPTAFAGAVSVMTVVKDELRTNDPAELG